MPRTVILGIVLTLMVAGSGCQLIKPEKAQEISSLPTLESRRDARTLVIAIDDYPPFEYMENGVLKGISIDLCREIFARMGYTTEITAYPFARAIDMAKTGEADAVMTIYQNTARQEWADYPEEALCVDRQCFFGLPGTRIDYDGSISSLQKFRIGVIRGYTLGEAFDTAVAEGSLQVEPVDNNMENIEKALNGRIDVFIDGENTTMFFLKQEGLTGQIVRNIQTFRDVNLYIAFSKKRKHQDLLGPFNETIRQMKVDGTYNDILHRYQVYTH